MIILITSWLSEDQTLNYGVAMRKGLMIVILESEEHAVTIYENADRYTSFANASAPELDEEPEKHNCTTMSEEDAARLEEQRGGEPYWDVEDVSLVLLRRWFDSHPVGSLLFEDLDAVPTELGSWRSIDMPTKVMMVIIDLDSDPVYEDEDAGVIPFKLPSFSKEKP